MQRIGWTCRCVKHKLQLNLHTRIKTNKQPLHQRRRISTVIRTRRLEVHNNVRFFNLFGDDVKLEHLLISNVVKDMRLPNSICNNVKL
uniref:Uncharacterized protein n=1 Tax=Physcomitrium patens TaxID=3218 RepID=A0A2K1ICV6_PHYPA|nr:hypothetical protein PHYPA_030594 [Physcomitrium patens]